MTAGSNNTSNNNNNQISTLIYDCNVLSCVRTDAFHYQINLAKRTLIIVDDLSCFHVKTNEKDKPKTKMVCVYFVWFNHTHLFIWIHRQFIRFTDD